MNIKMITIGIIGLMICSSFGVIGASIGKNETNPIFQNTTDRTIRHADVAGVLFSFIKVKARDNTATDTGGYSLYYLLVARGDHTVSWNLDYTVWYTTGEHTHGSQNGYANTISIGPIQINYGRMKFNWANFNNGFYQAGLFCDGNETDDDEDDDGDYDGEFGVDAGDDYEANVGETIQFMGTAWGGVEPYTWLWYFGDGNTSSEQNPQYAYAAEGEYEVLLEVTDANGSVASDHTEAEIGDECEDEFQAHAGGEYEADVNETIQFYGFAEGGEVPYTWLWYFGDGATSTEQNPTHAYTQAGEYDVELIVTDATNQTATDHTEAEIGDDEGEEDEFEAHAGDEYEADVNETIQFYGSAENGVEPYTWFWNFGDGTTSTEQNPTHAYAQAGEYDVMLTVTDATNQTATDHTEAEIGDDEGEEGEDDFWAHAGGDHEAAVDEPIQFYGTAGNGVEPYTWLWDFGDGATSTEQNPVHAYTSEGEYTVQLTVTDATNQTACDHADVEIGEDQ